MSVTTCNYVQSTNIPEENSVPILKTEQSFSKRKKAGNSSAASVNFYHTARCQNSEEEFLSVSPL